MTTQSGFSVEENLRRELTRRKASLLRRRDQAGSPRSDIAAAVALATFHDTLALFEQWGPEEIKAVINDIREMTT